MRYCRQSGYLLPPLKSPQGADSSVISQGLSLHMPEVKDLGSEPHAKMLVTHLAFNRLKQRPRGPT